MLTFIPQISQILPRPKKGQNCIEHFCRFGKTIIHTILHIHTTFKVFLQFPLEILNRKFWKSQQIPSGPGFITWLNIRSFQTSRVEICLLYFFTENLFNLLLILLLLLLTFIMDYINITFFCIGVKTLEWQKPKLLSPDKILNVDQCIIHDNWFRYTIRFF